VSRQPHLTCRGGADERAPHAQCPAGSATGQPRFSAAWWCQGVRHAVRGRGPCACLCLLGVSSSAVARPSVGYLCVRHGCPAQPAQQEHSVPCVPQGSSKCTPTCVAPTGGRCGQRRNTAGWPASTVAACINATAAASMFSKLQCCCRCGRAGRAGRGGRGVTAKPGTTQASHRCAAAAAALACSHPPTPSTHLGYRCVGAVGTGGRAT